MLVQRYPDSPYTKQANNRIRIAEDILAASRDERRRATTRTATTMSAPSTATRWWSPSTRRRAHVEEALYRIVETNMALGIVPEAQAAAAVLGHNFPNSDWYKRPMRC